MDPRKSKKDGGKGRFPGALQEQSDGSEISISKRQSFLLGFSVWALQDY